VDAATVRETELKERIRQLQHALQDEQAKGVPERRDRAIDAFTEDLSAAEREYETLLDDRRRTSGRFAVLAQPITYDAARTQLSADEAVVEYLVDRDAVIAFVITNRALDAYVQPIAETDLTAKIELLRDLIRRPESAAWQKPANSLAKALLEPLRSSGVLNGVTKLQVVPHGVLNYLPFDVLPLGDGVLIDVFALGYLPSAAALALAPGTTVSPETMLVMAPAGSGIFTSLRMATSTSRTPCCPDSNSRPTRITTGCSKYTKSWGSRWTQTSSR
jgi:CHAT domain-containing protein